MIDVQTQGQEYILQYVDLCPNGPISFTTFIEVPLMELDIVAESSIAEYSTEEYTTAVSCAGVDDAYATVSISGGSAK